MKPYFISVFSIFENVLHPAAGKAVAGKKRNRSASGQVNPKATPDSMNIRDIMKRQDSFRRNPAP